MSVWRRIKTASSLLEALDVARNLNLRNLGVSAQSVLETLGYLIFNRKKTDLFIIVFDLLASKRFHFRYLLICHVNVTLILTVDSNYFTITTAIR